MRPTVKDVASLAEVSPKTVSNVLGGTVPVADATRGRVEQAIETLGYVPNLAARGLRNGRSGIVALVMPELGTPFSAELSHEFVELAHAEGLAVQIEQSWDAADRALEMMARARRHLVDGVVLNPTTLQQTERVLHGDGGVTGVPLVLLGEVPQGDVDQVRVDGVEGARAAVRHLLDRGHRRIAAVGVPGGGLDTATGHERREGYRLAHSDAKVPVDALLEVTCPLWTPAGGAAATRALVGSGVGFDALFCFTDSIAIGALSALWWAGLRVPEDVSVVGFDDIADAEFATPPLTTVHIPKRAYAAAALERLVARIGGSTERAQVVTVPARLVERESVRTR